MLGGESEERDMAVVRCGCQIDVIEVLWALKIGRSNFQDDIVLVKLGMD